MDDRQRDIKWQENEGMAPLLIKGDLINCRMLTWICAKDSPVSIQPPKKGEFVLSSARRICNTRI
jgi:hypothetical protein